MSGGWKDAEITGSWLDEAVRIPDDSLWRLRHGPGPARLMYVRKVVAEMRERAEADPTPVRTVTKHDLGSAIVTLDTRG